mmetsp:Transcript_16184/g.65420  ORF Transcript_16184/g.65420 Transcript_16184/m.65420 type:complete len:142 (+) Transcript_16184:497-922(+)
MRLFSLLDLVVVTKLGSLFDFPLVVSSTRALARTASGGTSVDARTTFFDAAQPRLRHHHRLAACIVSGHLPRLRVVVSALGLLARPPRASSSCCGSSSASLRALTSSFFTALLSVTVSRPLALASPVLDAHRHESKKVKKK